MGPRLFMGSLSKKLSHLAIVGSAAARPWDIHSQQVSGVVHVHSDDSAAFQQHLLLPLITPKAG